MMAQGEVLLADLPAPVGQRPVLILTRSDKIAAMQNVTVATISSKIRAIETEVELSEVDGLGRACAVSLDNIHTLRKDYLARRITVLSGQRMNEVWEA